MSSQIKGEFTSEWQATNLARKLVDDKRRSKAGYKDAAKGLDITGLPALKTVNLSHVHVSNQQPNTSKSVINLDDGVKARRNIKVV